MPSNRKLALYLSLLTKYLFILSGIVLFVSYFSKGQLPSPAKMDQRLKDDPVQTRIDESPFDFEYHNKTYVIKPVASYEIHGLVVSHNNISAFTDIYHDKSSVDIKDLCLIWGENIQSSNYLNLKFWSEPWSCHYFTKSEVVFENFFPDKLSNNHLLSTDSSVRKTIQSIKIGDQVYLSGQLINYYQKDTPSFIRKTSLTRKDTGNGACEVFLVDQAQILRRGATIWDKTYDISKTLFVISLVLKLLIFLFLPYEYSPAARR